MMAFTPKPEKPWHSYQEMDYIQKNQPEPSTDPIGTPYECKFCSMGFEVQRIYEKHVENCRNKLWNPVSFILMAEEEEPVFSGKGGVGNVSKALPMNDHNIEPTDNNSELKASGFRSNEFVVDEETTDTPFLAAQTDMNRIIEQLDNDLIELDSQNPDFVDPTNITVCGNTDDNMDLEIVEENAENDDQEIIIETFTDHSSNEQNVKILRVLSLPKNETYNKSREEKQSLHIVKQQSQTVKKFKPRTKFTKLRKLPPKPLECINIKLEQPTHDPKPKLHVRTYAEKTPNAGSNNKGDQTLIQPGKKLYSVIEKPKKVEEVTELSVFDFVDEEDEKKKAQNERLKQELKQVHDRTCQICGKLFDDPIDVLPHKREQHPTKKVRIPKEKLKVYLELECRPVCPLCFKQIPMYKYRSIFTKHLMTHSAEPGFECEICGTKYKRKDHLENHKKRHVFVVS